MQYYHYSNILTPYYGLESQHDLVPAFPTSSCYFLLILLVYEVQLEWPSLCSQNVYICHLKALSLSHLELFYLECCSPFPHPPPQSLQGFLFRFQLKCHPSNMGNDILIIHSKVATEPLFIIKPFESFSWFFTVSNEISIYLFVSLWFVSHLLLGCQFQDSTLSVQSLCHIYHLEHCLALSMCSRNIGGG